MNSGRNALTAAEEDERRSPRRLTTDDQTSTNNGNYSRHESGFGRRTMTSEQDIRLQNRPREGEVENIAQLGNKSRAKKTWQEKEEDEFKGKHKQPYYVHSAAEATDPEPPLLWAAGLCDGATFTLLTTDAPARLAWLHDRMPVVLDEAHPPPGSPPPRIRALRTHANSPPARPLRTRALSCRTRGRGRQMSSAGESKLSC